MDRQVDNRKGTGRFYHLREGDIGERNLNAQRWRKRRHSDPVFRLRNVALAGSQAHDSRKLPLERRSNPKTTLVGGQS